MTAELIDGKGTAARLRAGLAERVAALRAERGLAPGLAVVLVGEDPASQVYVASKERQAAEVGMHSVVHRLPADVGQQALLAQVAALNADPAIHGILVQLPLPQGQDYNAHAVLLAIDPAKDVDGFHPVNAGLLAIGRPGLVPCTPKGCLMLLKAARGADLSGLDALVIGRSTIVGKPMAHLLLGADCTVTLAHSRTRDLAGLCRRMDIVVAAVGRPQMVTAEWIKPGATVIDVGMNRLAPEPGKDKGRLVGDVDFAGVREVAGAITPVPGGVGPMTIACLLDNTLEACLASLEG